MGRIITLQAQDAWGANDHKAEGVTCKKVPYSYDYDGKHYEGVHKFYRLPELGPKRILKDGDPIVLPIQGRRWRIIIETPRGLDYDAPEPGRVTFIETDEPETEYTVWDGIAKMKDVRRSHEAELAEVRKYRSNAESPEDAEWYDKEIEDTQRRIREIDKALEDGQELYSPTARCSAFGQPVFIQNEQTPAYEGRAAYHLLTFETGWGDSGNENYMVALDALGKPVAVYHEASCC